MHSRINQHEARHGAFNGSRPLQQSKCACFYESAPLFSENASLAHSAVPIAYGLIYCVCKYICSLALFVAVLIGPSYLQSPSTPVASYALSHYGKCIPSCWNRWVHPRHASPAACTGDRLELKLYLSFSGKVSTFRNCLSVKLPQNRLSSL